MAIAVVLEFKDATLDQYDEVIEEMGFEPGGQGPLGALGHWVTGTDDGFRVTDLWARREQFDQFAAEKIGPLSQEAGLTAQPETTFYEVHNYLTPGPGA
jgi:hypothetical protein